MCKKEFIKVGTLREPAVNISFSVGQGAENGPADVMLIQTIFHYIAHIKGKAMHNLGFPLDQLPSITGKCDQKTKNAIFRFQQRNANRLLSIDGVISPASYEGRTIQPGQRYMTMTWLHFLCTEMSVFHSESNYIDGLVKMIPRLRPWLA